MEEIWLDGTWASSVDAEILPDSLYHYYNKSLGLLIGRIEDSVGIGNMPRWTLPETGKVPGDLVGCVERMSRATNGEIVEFSRTWFNPDRVRYVARFK